MTEAPANGLTPAESERLTCLIEECTEVIKCITKIQRHGYDSKDPTDPDHPGNRAHLALEITDVLAAIAALDYHDDVLVVHESGYEIKHSHHETIKRFAYIGIDYKVDEEV